MEMTSPTIIKELEVELTFYKALEKVVEGKKITKLEWDNRDEYGFMREEILHIRRNGKDHKWILSEADIVGEDYQILAEEI